ncbi:MAG: hypothetical protein ACUVUC_14025 [Thermoguttaceae bacterium]
MDPSAVIDALNRLFQVHYRSLPVYLHQARPWSPRGQDAALEVLATVAADQQRTAQQIAEAILREGGRVEPGQFPVRFAALHDLAADFLLCRAAELHQRDMEAIQQCAAELRRLPALRPLAEQVLQQARRHQEMLEGRMADEG